MSSDPTGEASTKPSGRVLTDWSGDAAWNMAVDQALAESIAEQGSSAALRFYTWREPTLSLGYFQSADEADPRFENVRKVRRSTGGGAILHHHELTYSLVVRTRRGEHGARHDLYRKVHAAIVDELATRSIVAAPYRDTTHAAQAVERDADQFLCFRRRTDEDLIVSGYKVLGSAQRRTRGAILQHGSLLLRSSPLADELPGIFDLTSQKMDISRLAQSLTRSIGDAIGIAFTSSELDPREQSGANEIAETRFSNPRWWNRR